MDTIRNYLENLFSSLPKTQQVLDAKQHLLENMLDKYDELKAQGKTENEAIGIVISEFGNIDELKNELGISNAAQSDNSVPVLQEAYVSEYIKTTTVSNRFISLGVALCITSPIGIIIGAGFENFIPGMIMLFSFIAIAVGIFIFAGTKVEKYEHLKNGNFVLSERAKQKILDYNGATAGKRTGSLIFGVLMCILSPVPLICYSLTVPENVADTSNEGLITLILVGVLLLMVSIGVTIMICFGTSEETCKILLKKDEYDPKTKEENKLTSVIAGIYWPVIALAYFIWSFLGNNWDISWVIWPIAGILFGVIAATISAITKIGDENKRNY